MYSLENFTGRPTHSRGITLIEMIAAGMLLGTLMLVTLPLLAKLSEVRQDAADREFAIRELRNLLETHLDDVPDESLPPDLNAFSRLEQPELTIDTAPQADGSQRVSYTLTWINSAGQPVQPVELSRWRFPEERQP